MVDLVLIETVSYIIGALGVFVAAVFYVLNLRISQRSMKQTLETRQAQMFMNIYDKTTTKEYRQAWMKFVRAPFSNWTEYNKLFNEDEEFKEAYWFTTNFYEGVGVLVREGLLPIRMVALLICGPTRRYFEKVMLFLEEGRKATGFNRWYSEGEYLYVELLKYLKEHPELDTRLERLPSELR
jgi:hypothetical protein